MLASAVETPRAPRATSARSPNPSALQTGSAMPTRRSRSRRYRLEIRRKRGCSASTCRGQNSARPRLSQLPATACPPSKPRSRPRRTAVQKRMRLSRSTASRERKQRRANLGHLRRATAAFRAETMPMVPRAPVTPPAAPSVARTHPPGQAQRALPDIEMAAALHGRSPTGKASACAGRLGRCFRLVRSPSPVPPRPPTRHARICGSALCGRAGRSPAPTCSGHHRMGR